MIDRPFVRAEFEVGAKYRIYFYVVPGNLADIDNTRVELLGACRQSVNFVLTKHSRKRFLKSVAWLLFNFDSRYTQNCEDYEVFCYECGGDDVHGILGGRLSSSLGH